jgi:hypothetical protein
LRLLLGSFAFVIHGSDLKEYIGVPGILGRQRARRRSTAPPDQTMW